MSSSIPSQKDATVKLLMASSTDSAAIFTVSSSEKILSAVPRVDLTQKRVHIRGMDFDISRFLDDWEYQPGKVAVRKFTGADGKQKIQLRVDLGILQMNAEGRPDGKRPFGHTSLFEYYQSKLAKFQAANDGSEDGFELQPEDCAKLQIEALQYHHRYICLLELGDFPAVVRDAERNLALFDFVGKHAGSDDLAWSLQQFQPQLMMILTRARALQSLKSEEHNGAIAQIEHGLDDLRAFFNEHSRHDLIAQSGEIQSLETWLGEIRAARPLTPREKLEQALNEAVQREDYEKAAQMRDALRNLKTHE